jgi:flagellar hook-associated protein 3 FlgL
MLRVPTTAATRSTLAAIAASRAAMDEAMTRATTGRRIETAADDPAASVGLLRAEGQLRAREQYQRNISSARTRLDLEDSVLDQLGRTMDRARELATAMGSASTTDAARRTAALEAAQLLRGAVALSGTSIGDEQLFGGHRPDVAPFSLDESGPTPALVVADSADSPPRRVEIAGGQTFTATHGATEVFGDASGGPLAALQALTSALASGDAAAVRDAMPALDAAAGSVQRMVAETGARGLQLEATSAGHRTMITGLETEISDVRDINLEEAIVTLTTRQTAYQAALAATARIGNISLADYLR